MSKAIDDNVARQPKPGATVPVQTNEMPVQFGIDGQSSNILSQIEESCLAHLTDEKETLLRTGVYALNDPIIVELNKQITELIMKSRK